MSYEDIFKRKDDGWTAGSRPSCLSDETVCSSISPHGFQFHASLICDKKCSTCVHKVCKKWTLT